MGQDTGRRLRGTRLAVAAAAFPLALASAPALAQNVAAPPATPARVDPIAARIKYLHDRLRLTKAQEPLWAKVAQAIRGNAKSLEPMLRARMRSATSGDAVAILDAYQSLGQARLDGLKKFIAAFDPLYASLGANQKKIADAILRQGPLNAMVGALPEVPPALGSPLVSLPTPAPEPVPYPLYEPYYYGPEYGIVGPVIASPPVHFRGLVPRGPHLGGFHR